MAKKIKAKENWNIKFIGKRLLLNGEVEELEAPESYLDSELIELPSDEEQKAGFFLESASRLARLYPNWYKLRVIVVSDKKSLETTQQSADMLSDDFPGIKVFREKGINSTAQLTQLSLGDLELMDGIGNKTIKAIQDLGLFIESDEK